jgi:hypothetical protein
MEAQAYDLAEIARLNTQLEAVERAPLSERKEARRDYFKTLGCSAGPEIIARRIGWLLQGDYNHGAKLAARRIVETHGNQAAQLRQLLAAVEYHCPAAFARGAWCKLAPARQKTVNEEITMAIAEWRMEQTL